MDLYLPGEEKFGFLSSLIYSLFSEHFLNDLYDMVVEDALILRPSTILDVGCGPGIADYRLASSLPGAEIYCIDPSPHMLDLARKRLQKFDERIRIAPGNSRWIPFDAKFDFIFASLSFHHWNRKEQGLKNISKYVSDKNGVIGIYEYFRDNLKGIYKLAGNHSLRMDTVESMNIEGFEKRIKIIDRRIGILFFKR